MNSGGQPRRDRACFAVPAGEPALYRRAAGSRVGRTAQSAAPVPPVTTRPKSARCSTPGASAVPTSASNFVDMALFIVAIAAINGIGLAMVVERKMAESERRLYRRDQHGFNIQT